jgi:ABC-type transporter Mla MlaB component
MYWFITFRHGFLHCEFLSLLSLANSRSRIHELFELFNKYTPYINKMHVACLGNRVAQMQMESMLKITTTESDDGVLTIGIAGRLTPSGCESVERVLRDARCRNQQVKIELAGIRLVDQASVEYLAHIRRRDVELVNVPAYVIRWIEQISTSPDFWKRESTQFNE